MRHRPFIDPGNAPGDHVGEFALERGANAQGDEGAFVCARHGRAWKGFTAAWITYNVE